MTNNAMANCSVLVGNSGEMVPDVFCRWMVLRVLDVLAWLALPHGLNDLRSQRFPRILPGGYDGP
jgi:hypothetical protein